MRPFDAKIRTSYRDIENLVLDCRNSDVELDGSLWMNTAPPARVLESGAHNGPAASADLYDSPGRWVENRLIGRYVYNLTDNSIGLITANTSNKVVAILDGGGGNDWDAGDVYQITTPRFGNPYQDTVAKQPTIIEAAGIREVVFAYQELMNIPLAFPFKTTGFQNMWGMSFDLKPGPAPAGVTENVIGFQNFSIWNALSGGGKGFSVFPTSKTYAGDMDEATWTFSHIDSSNAQLFRNGVSLGSGSAAYLPINANDPTGYIGSSDGAANLGNFSLYGLQIWDRPLLDTEADLIAKTSSVRADRSSLAWAEMSLRDWIDPTGPASEPSRINSTPYASQKFTVANINGGNRVQISASVLGDLLSDAQAGSTFDLEAIEHPDPSNPPQISNPHAGWSALFDVILNAVGHYTFIASKADGGRVLLHLDAEDVA